MNNGIMQVDLKAMFAPLIFRRPSNSLFGLSSSLIYFPGKRGSGFFNGVVVNYIFFVNGDAYYRQRDLETDYGIDTYPSLAWWEIAYKIGRAFPRNDENLRISLSLGYLEFLRCQIGFDVIW